MNRVQIATDRPVQSTNFSIPQTTNFCLAALQIFVNVFQLFILPLYFLPKDMWWGLILIPIAVMNNPCWALIHEAIHGLLNRSARVNLAVGRLLSIFFGAPFQVLRLTHLSHHKFNRSPLEKGTEIYDPDEVSKLKAGFRYFSYILCGLYLLEVSSTFLFFLPPRVFRKMRQRVIGRGNIQEKWLASKFTNNRIREIRIDGLAICLIFGLGAYCYRQHWGLLLNLVLVRTFFISFLDNVYHYGTPVNVTISGYNLSLPTVFATFLLNFNLHRVHHARPSVPWVELPKVFVRDSETFDYNFFAAALRQLYGPVPLTHLGGAAPAIQRS